VQSTATPKTRRSPATAISSRYDDPSEIVGMDAALRRLPRNDRRAIAAIWTNSKNGWVALTLHPGREAAANRIGAAYHAALVAATGVFAMLAVWIGDDCVADFDGGDPGDDEEPCPWCGSPGRLP
jgi:hypothetical protein